MPDLDGLSTLDKITSENSHAQRMMVSALHQEPIVMERLRRGATDFLAEPSRKST